MRRAILILALAAVVSAFPLAAQAAPKTGDWLMLAPAALKAAAPLALVPEALRDPDAFWAVGGGLAFWTAPNVLLGWNVAAGNPGGTRFWRHVSMGIDGLALAGFLGVGTWMVLKPDTTGWDGLVGALYLVMAVPVGGALALDFFPFPLERAAP